jgi:alpha-ribazole phosphatase
MALEDVHDSLPDWVAVRHGETQAGHCYLGRTDAELTEIGWQQMSSAFGVKDIRLETPSLNSLGDVIISSPLKRCSLFAKTLAQALKINCFIEPRLQEFNFGRWDGQTAEQILNSPDASQLEAFWADPVKYPPPDGETLEHFSTRVLAGHTVIKQYIQQGHRPIVITHGGVIKALRCLQSNWSFDKMWNIRVEHGSLHPFNLSPPL